MRVGVMLTSCLGLACAARADETPKPPEIVQHVIAGYETNVRGVIGMQRHFSTLINAGIAKHTEVSESAILFKDGVFEAVHYYRVLEDGKEFSATQLSDRDKQTADVGRPARCFSTNPTIAGSPATIHSRSSLHVRIARPGGSGQIRKRETRYAARRRDDVDDAAEARVVKLTYSPYVYPPHATSGTVTEISGAALPNLWYVVRIDQAFTGHMFFCMEQRRLRHSSIISNASDPSPKVRARSAKGRSVRPKRSAVPQRGVRPVGGRDGCWAIRITPLLPLMEHGAGLSHQMAGLIASSNLASYRSARFRRAAGAFARDVARRKVGDCDRRRDNRSHGIYARIRLDRGSIRHRCRSGFAFVLGSSIVLDRVARERRPD